MLVAAVSHIGLVRQTNQDVYQVGNLSDAVRFLVVADGMGGASAGEVASRIAVDAVTDKLQGILETTDGDAVDWVDVLRDGISRANREVWQSSQHNEEYLGMGTTMVAAICSDEQVIFAHVGDSRGYLMHVNYLKQVTKDHSLVAELVRRGQLTPDEAANHPQRNIVTRSLGTTPEMMVDVDLMRWQVGDAVLLCSDGLSNLVEEAELLEHMLPLRDAKTKEDVEVVVQKLLQLGLDRGASDNITLAIAVHNEGNDEA